jgi:hypothetical protein
MWKSFKVIDADAHTHEPNDMWDRHVEAKYKDRGPKVAYMDGTRTEWNRRELFLISTLIQSPLKPSARSSGTTRSSSPNLDKLMGK